MARYEFRSVFADEIKNYIMIKQKLALMVTTSDATS